MTESEPQTADQERSVTNHVVVDLWSRETAREAIEYRVGPACNYAEFSGKRGPKLVLWGDSLTRSDLRALSTACHELEREHSDMAMYDAASEADRMEGEFLRGDETYLQTEDDQ